MAAMVVATVRMAVDATTAMVAAVTTVMHVVMGAMAVVAKVAIATSRAVMGAMDAAVLHSATVLRSATGVTRAAMTRSASRATTRAQKVPRRTRRVMGSVTKANATKAVMVNVTATAPVASAPRVNHVHKTAVVRSSHARQPR